MCSYKLIIACVDVFDILEGRKLACEMHTLESIFICPLKNALEKFADVCADVRHNVFITKNVFTNEKNTIEKY